MWPRTTAREAAKTHEQERDTANLHGNSHAVNKVREREFTGSKASLYILIKEYKHWTFAYSAPQKMTLETQMRSLDISVGECWQVLHRHGP